MSVKPIYAKGGGGSLVLVPVAVRGRGLYLSEQLFPPRACRREDNAFSTQ